VGSIRMGPPPELVVKLAYAFRIPNFVETGTYHGDTAVWAARFFSKVNTIEYSKDLHSQVMNKYGNIGNVEFSFGDSRTELSRIITQLSGPALFWLDAHWCSAETYGVNDECPLIEEIKIINQNKCDSFILIDDARLFESPPPPPHKKEQWPDIASIMKLLRSGEVFRYTAIVEDVIVAVPFRARQPVMDYCQKIRPETFQ